MLGAAAGAAVAALCGGDVPGAAAAGCGIGALGVGLIAGLGALDAGLGAAVGAAAGAAFRAAGRALFGGFLGRLVPRMGARFAGNGATKSSSGIARSATNNAKAIENARRLGVNRAKAAERDLVKNGHPGTADDGGWTFAERKRIAESGKFPDDTRWHHINDVRRNPDLADAADNVIPSRGETAGHVTKYHPNGTRAGSSGPLLNRNQLKKDHLNGN